MHIKRIYQWVVSDYNFKTYNIYEIPEEKLFQGLKAIGKRYSTYVAVASVLELFSWSRQKA